jgi:hypothetical protein
MFGSKSAALTWSANTVRVKTPEHGDISARPRDACVSVEAIDAVAVET